MYPRYLAQLMKEVLPKEILAGMMSLKSFQYFKNYFIDLKTKYFPLRVLYLFYFSIFSTEWYFNLKKKRTAYLLDLLFTSNYFGNFT